MRALRESIMDNDDELDDKIVEAQIIQFLESRFNYFYNSYYKYKYTFVKGNKRGVKCVKVELANPNKEQTTYTLFQRGINTTDSVWYSMIDFYNNYAKREDAHKNENMYPIPYFNVQISGRLAIRGSQGVSSLEGIESCDSLIFEESYGNHKNNYQLDLGGMEIRDKITVIRSSITFVGKCKCPLLVRIKSYFDNVKWKCSNKITETYK